jgi:hypothetical protein
MCGFPAVAVDSRRLSYFLEISIFEISSSYLALKQKPVT